MVASNIGYQRKAKSAARTVTAPRTDTSDPRAASAPAPAIAAPVARGAVAPEATARGPNNENEILSSIKGLFSSGPSASSAAAPALTNVAQNNPDIGYALGEMRKRYEGDAGAGQAIDVATSKIRDATTGLAREAAAGRTARGVSGTGVDDFDTRRLFGNAQRAVAGTSADITMGRERDKDAILGGITSGGAQQAAVLAQEHDRNLRQWESAQQNARAEEDRRLAREMSILNMLSNLSFA